jgi:hypothetical protein
MSGFIQLEREPFRRLMQKFRARQRAGAHAFWIEALMRANYEDGPYDGELLKRGQFLFGREEMARTLGLSERQVRTLTERFKKLSELTIETSSRGTKTTIVNYDTYVGSPPQNDQQNDQQTTSKRPANDHSEEVNKQINKEENIVPFEERFRQRRNS